MSTTLAGFNALPLPIFQLSLAAVLNCGQSFRWTSYPLFLKSGDSDSLPSNDVPAFEYRYCLKDRIVCLRQTTDTLYYRAVYPNHAGHISSGKIDPGNAAKRDAETVAFIRDYFQLHLNLSNLYDEWSRRDPVFRALRDRFSGIRVLRQDPWECLISFICSSNNNISRITKMVQSLCLHFTQPIATLDTPTAASASIEESVIYHPFPSPSTLADPSVTTKLRTLGFGYRADFINKTAAMLIQDHGSDGKVYEYLAGLRELSAENARAELLKCMGVGRKVADCVLLMSLDKLGVVPVDTHVYQIAVKHYGVKGSSGKMTMSAKLYDDLNRKFAGIWGEYAGWAHLILFAADLKSFASYGLPAVIPSPQSSVEKSRNDQKSRSLETSPTLPRKRKETRSKDAHLQKFTDVSSMQQIGDGDLADRVKRRRRLTSYCDASSE